MKTNTSSYRYFETKNFGLSNIKKCIKKKLRINGNRAK